MKSDVSESLKKSISQLVINMDGKVLPLQEVITIFWLYDSINREIPVPYASTSAKGTKFNRFLASRQVKMDATETPVPLDHFLMLLSYIRKQLAIWRNENALLKLEADNKVNMSFLGKDIHTPYELSLIDDMKKGEFASLYQKKYSPTVLFNKCKNIVDALKLGESCEDKIIEYIAILSRLDVDTKNKWIANMSADGKYNQDKLAIEMKGVLEEISLEDFRNLLSTLDLWDHKHSFPAPLFPKKKSKKA